MNFVNIVLVPLLSMLTGDSLPAQPSLKVLFIGNSQMQCYDLPQMIGVMSESAPSGGPRLEVGRALFGGKGLEGFWEAGEGPGAPRAMIAAGKWDYVVIQEIYSANQQDFQDYAARFDDAIRKSGAKTILFATASVTEHYSRSFHYPDSFKKLNDMQIALAKKRGIPVAPAGYAWMKYWGPHPTEQQMLDLYHMDKGHPGTKGTYIYACLLYAVITGKNPTGLISEFKSIRGGFAIPKEEAARMQQAAWEQYQGSTEAFPKTEPSSRAKPSVRPIVKIVPDGESKVRPEDCRATLVGPGVNQPDPFPGYGGFVGWVSPCRAENGDWLVGFSAGYWHASPPTPLRMPPWRIESYLKLGMPKDVTAPTGGRALLIRSRDGGKTWSKPTTLIDTPEDDRHPAFLQVPAGPLLCSLFTYSGAERDDMLKHHELAHCTVVVRSFDQGVTWGKDIIRLPSPFVGDESDGPLVLLKDGSILLTIDGIPEKGSFYQVAFFRSRDSGATWELLSTVSGKDHHLYEANTAELPDGQWVMIARPEGDICWSRDRGRTWTEPVTFGMRMFAPSLSVLRDGTLVCLHGSYAPGHGGLRLIFSTDGGHTWIAPAETYGFLVDRCYGYGKSMELPDGSLFVVYQDTGGHRTKEAHNMSIRCVRLRIRADRAGIELLPVPNHLN